MSNDLVQIARQRIDDTQRTHWEGCERDHRECLIQRMADEIERLRATLERQQLSYEREREIDQEEIERLRAQRRGDANALRMIADALGVPEDARHDGGIMRAIDRRRAQIADRPLVDALRALPDTRPEPEPFEVWREICGLALSSADEIDRLRAQIADADVLATYGRDDGWRDWVSVGTWLYPGDRVVVLRREDQR